MVKFKFLLCFFGVLLFAVVAHADLVISGTSGAGFQAGVVPNNDSTPYWDHMSDDGLSKTDPNNNKCNIGFVLNGTATNAICTSDLGPLPVVAPDQTGNFPFWGLASGAADSSFYFQHSAGQADNMELEVKITGWNGYDTFGWYDTATNTQHPVFGPSDNAEITRLLLIPGSSSFGFYFTSPAGTFYTQSGNNTTFTGADVGTQHFAVFRVQPPGTSGNETTTYYLGMEDDISGTGMICPPNGAPCANPSDYDYNDFVIEVTTVPEPVSIVLLGTVLCGVAFAFRRRYVTK